MTMLVSAKPARIALHWLQAQGFYVLATDGTRMAFVDQDDAVAAIRLVIDHRLAETPRGSC